MTSETQKTPDTEPEAPPELTRASPREAEAERIAATRRAPEEDPPEDPPEQLSLDEEEPADPPEPEPEDPPATVSIRVFPHDPDGFVADVPREEVEAAGGREAYAKAIAADIKMRRAEAREAKAEPPPAPELTPEQQANLDRLSEQYPDDFVDTAKRTYELENRQPDVNAIADEVLARARAQQAEERRQVANAYFTEHFDDVEANPDLLAIATRKANELMSTRPDMDQVDLVKEAGEYARDTHKRFVDQAQAALKETQERKRQLKGHNPPATSARAEAPPEVEPASRSDVIAQMRQARGMPA